MQPLNDGERRKADGMKRKPIIAADLFCGAGGTSSGLALACRAAGIEVDLLAVNHWQVAIDTHAAAHPWARHMCASLDNMRPQDVIPGGRLHLLVASPECTHHARARGGRPVNDQSRSTAWHICKWAQELYIDNILIENVREFREWGPIGANGKPLKSRKGETYFAFLNTLRSLGYAVEDRVLNAADYGDPTTRERLFIQARRKGKIAWPEPTHSARGNKTLFGSTKRWRAAKEIIDWTVENPSIFTRKKPLADTTMRRILAGMVKFNGHLEPFIVTLRNHVTPKSVEEPVGTITGGGTHIGLCEPFVLSQQSDGAPRSTDEPLPTVCTKGAIAVVEPFLIEVAHGKKEGDTENRRARSIDNPVPTVLCSNRIGLVEPFIIGHPRGKDGADKTPLDSIENPLRTVTATSCDMGLVEPFLVKVTHGKEDSGRPQSVEKPLPTLTTKNGVGLVEPFILNIDHQGGNGDQVRSAEEPLATVTTKQRACLVEPFIAKYYGTGIATSVEDPLDTVTTKDRFGLVQPEWNGYRLDIRFRMLQPHELAGAQGFPSDYPFTGNKSEIVKQIGNAVPVGLAKALCSALLADYAPKPALKAKAVTA